MKWFWGLLLVIIGVLFLGYNMHWWPDIQWQHLWYFWPWLLIIFGVGLIVKRWRYGWIIISIVLLAGLFFIYALIFTSKPIFNLKMPAQNATDTPIDIAIPQGVNQAKLTLNCGAIKMDIKGDSPKLMTGNMTSNLVKPKIEQKVIDNKVDIILSMEKTSGGWRLYQNTLELSLSNQIPWELVVNCGASDLQFDLSNLQIAKLDFQAGASSANFKIGPNIVDQSNFSLDFGASNLNILLSKDIGFDLTVESPLSSRHLTDFNQISENHFQTKNYTTAIKHVTLVIKAGASSINISSY